MGNLTVCSYSYLASFTQRNASKIDSYCFISNFLHLLSISPLFEYTIVFMSSPAVGQLLSFQFLTTMNKTALNVLIQSLYVDIRFHFSSVNTRSGMVGSKNRYV